MQNLPGKTAFITGGASGIGLGIAKALLGAGMNVVIADIRDDHLASAAAGACGRRPRARAEARCHGPRRLCSAADAAEAKFGKIHLLVNNAGVAVVGPTELATFADWDWVMGVNLGGVINGVTTILPRILSARRGRAYRQHLVDVGHGAGGRHDDLFHREGRCADDDGNACGPSWNRAA